MHKERKALQQRVEHLLRDKKTDAALAEYQAHLEKFTADWTAAQAYGELCLQVGDEDGALMQFARAADHLRDEGFLPKAAALYKMILRIRSNDAALLNLTDIAAREGRLVEAKGYLVELEKVRRARGDIQGADDCLLSLDALIIVKTNPAATVTSEEAPGYSDVTDTVEEALIQELLVEDPLPVTALTSAEPIADEPPVLPEAESRPLPPRSAQGRSHTRKPRPGKKTKPLQAVFNEMREQARQSDDAAAAHERFDLAQYHLRDGNEAAAMTELREAARAPQLRFAAAAQLGRLHVGRGELAAGVEWLERAVSSPPVSPDEGLAVLYELGDALQQSGEPARALAIFIELSSQRRNYRDVGARIATLSEGHTGGDA